MLDENDRNELVFRVLRLLFEETNGDIHNPVNFCDVYNRYCRGKGSRTDTLYDEDNLELRHLVRQHALDMNYIQLDLDNVDNVKITSEGIKEYKRTIHS